MKFTEHDVTSMLSECKKATARKREDSFNRNKIIAERHRRTLRRLYASGDPEHFQIGGHYDIRRPPTPEEFTEDMKAEVGTLGQELLLSQPPPQCGLPPPRLPGQPLSPKYDFPPRQSSARPPPTSTPSEMQSSPSPLLCAEPEPSRDDQIESDYLKTRADDMAGKHQEKDLGEIPLLQVFGKERIENKIEPERRALKF